MLQDEWLLRLSEGYIAIILKNLHEPRNLDVSVEISNLFIFNNTELENTFIVPLQLFLVQKKCICHIQSYFFLLFLCIENINNTTIVSKANQYHNILPLFQDSMPMCVTVCVKMWQCFDSARITSANILQLNNPMPTHRKCRILQ